MSTVRRWARDTFSREQLVAGVKQFAWVAPLTLLIWIYAEREQQDDETLRFPVTVRSTNPQFHARLVDPIDGFVQVTVRGTRSRLEEIVRQIGSRDPVMVDAVADGKTGVQSIPLETILNHETRFRGLAVESSTPTHVGVDVDRIDEVTLPVQLRDEDKGQVQEAVFTPGHVKVRVPHQIAVAAQNANQGQLVAYADLGKLTPGKSTRSNVRVLIAGVETADPVRIVPPTVAAAFDVRAADQAYTVANIPVTMDVTQNVNNAYSIRYTPPSVFNLMVRGPREAIERLSNNVTRVTASIPVTSADAEQETQDKKIIFVLPPDIRIHEDSKHEESVRLTVTKRGSAPE